MPIQLDLINFLKHQDQPTEPHPDDFPAPEDSGPRTILGTGFETDVSRAVHSALIMRPIFELENRRLRQNGEDDSSGAWEALDVMWVAFAILDVISELTEYQIGATRAEVIEKMLPFVRNQARARGVSISDEGLAEVLGKVFDHLVNRGKRYLPFKYTYFDGGAGKYRTRKFWLIKTVYTGEGSEALFSLTDEGYAAYFGLHETSALDATAIGNLRIKLLIERGNVDDAISVAEANRKQCIRKELEVRNTRRLIQRNIQVVDFERVRALAEEGIGQATDIQKEGARLQNMVIEHLLSSRGMRHGAKLHRLGEILEGLNNQLVKLSGELQQLPEDYHNHSHKLFRKRYQGMFPPMDEVMGRIQSMGEEDAARVGAEFIARIDPPARRSLFDPAAVIEACDRALTRQNVPGDRNQAMLEVDGAPIERFTPELDEEVMDTAFEMIRTMVGREGEVKLSALLQHAVKIGDNDILPVAVVMAVFQCVVDRRLAKKQQILVELVDPEARIGVDLSDDRRYRGHELILGPRKK